MTTTRVVALAAVALVAVLVVMILTGGGGTHRYKLIFSNAGQLVNDNDVQIGGRRVGSIKKVELTRDNRAQITIEVEEPYAPLHVGTTAVIRQTSLSGIANRYIALSPGPNSAPEYRDGATLPASATTTSVDLDQIFNTFDEKTRKGLATTIQGFADWYQGKGRTANGVAKYFPPSLAATRRLAEQLAADKPALRALVRNTGSVMAALGAKGDTLTQLVANTNTTLGAVAAENQSLDQALQYLAPTLRRGSTTFVNLRGVLGDFDKLVAVSKPATKNLEPFLKQLTPLLTESQPTINNLAKLLQQPGPQNDLTDLLNDAPQLASVAHTSFANSITALNKSLPVLTFIRPYTPDFVGWLRDFGQSTSNYDANGHYARVQPVFNSFKYSQTANTLTPVPAPERTPGLQNGPQLVPRCPGAAVQAPADGSAPWRDTSGTLDCNPAIVPPGQ